MPVIGGALRMAGCCEDEALIILQQPIADSGTAVFAHLGCDASGTEFAGKMRRRDK
jgi:hypothetical protein